VAPLGVSEATQRWQTDGKQWWLEPFPKADGVGSGGGEGGESRALILGLGFEFPFILLLILDRIKSFHLFLNGAGNKRICHGVGSESGRQP
jgi:hypothetical protein